MCKEERTTDEGGGMDVCLRANNFVACVARLVRQCVLKEKREHWGRGLTHTCERAFTRHHHRMPETERCASDWSVFL